MRTPTVGRPPEVRGGENNVLETYTHGPDLSGTLGGAGGIGSILSVAGSAEKPLLKNIWKILPKNDLAKCPTSHDLCLPLVF
ncbi:MAG: hypothetical protein M5U15_14730 [Kiritimatiellae bacterium]|nr:hypothetical protein [Kiritimatiellia bacterium]